MLIDIGVLHVLFQVLNKTFYYKLDKIHTYLLQRLLTFNQ